MTIRELSTLYLNYTILKHKPKTIKMETYALKKFSEYYTGNLLVKHLKPISVEMWLLNKYSVHPTTAHHIYRILKAMFNWGVRNEMIKNNPFATIKLPRLKVKHPVFITKEEFLLILENEPAQKHRDIYTIAFYTGLRLGEIINLEWRFLNLDKKSLTVANIETFSTKSNKDREIPLCKPVYETLLNMYKKRNIYNKYVTIRLSGSYLSHRFVKAVRRANFTDRHIHFHTLRHSFASNLVCKGVNLYAVKELLGHADYATTQIYAHLQQQPLVDAVNLLD